MFFIGYTLLKVSISVRHLFIPVTDPPDSASQTASSSIQPSSYSSRQINARLRKNNKNSSGDEIANVNFYVVRPEATRIHWNNAK